MRPNKKESGASLVGLMVGMVIALLAVVGGLTLYKNAVRQTAGPGGVVTGSQQDGQLATGLLSAQIALQGAGYGIPGAASNSELLLLSNAALDGGQLSGDVLTVAAAAQAGNALVWISNPDLSAVPADQVCQALLSDPGSRALLLLRAQGNCQPLATNWSQLQWTAQSLVGANLLAEPVALNARRSSACWPFGALPQAMTARPPQTASVEVGLAYGGSVAGSANQYTSCLANLSQ